MSTCGWSSLRPSIPVLLAAALGACSSAPYTGGGPLDLDAPSADLGAAVDLQAPPAPAEGRLRFARTFAAEQASARATATDAAGHIVVGGRFYGRADLGGGEVTAPGTQSDAFVIKLGPNGKALWARTATGPAHNLVWDLAVDKAGSIIAVGYSLGTIDFGTGPLPGSEPGFAASFVVKYAADGTLLWARTFSTLGLGDNKARSVTVDAEDNLLITGSLESKVDFGGGAIDPGVFDGTFLVKLAPDGRHLLSRLVGPASGFRGEVNQIRVAPDGDLLLAGSALGTVDLGGGPIPVDGTDRHAFFLRLGQAGTYKLARLLGRDRSSVSVGSNLAVDRDGDLLLTGYFTGSLDCGGGQRFESPRNALYIARYTASGEHRWSRGVPSAAGHILPGGLALDSASRVVVGGEYTDVVSFDPPLPRVQSQKNLFLLKLDRDGSSLWSRGYGPASGAATTLDVAVDPADHTIAVGSFNGTIDFSGTSLTSGDSGKSDGLFVAKLSP